MIGENPFLTPEEEAAVFVRGEGVHLRRVLKQMRSSAEVRSYVARELGDTDTDTDAHTGPAGTRPGA